MHQVRIEQQGPRIVMLLDGRLVFDADWRYAEQVGRALVARSAQARLEERQRAG